MTTMEAVFPERLFRCGLRACVFVALLVSYAGFSAAADDPFEKVEYGCVRIDVQGGGSGTGFFVHTNGYVLSNYHVIQGGRQVRIRTRDGKTHPVSHVLNYNARHDLVLLKTDVSPSVVLKIALPEETKVGMDVFVIGSPQGVTWARAKGKVEGFVYDGLEQLQHTAKTAAGNSGSPIFDENGVVHGLHTMSVARQVKSAHGAYRLDWSDPKFRGVTSRILAAFLEQPHRPTSFAALASRYEAAETANMILWACQNSDRTMRLMHSAIQEMGTLTHVRVDPSRKTLSGRPVAVSRRTYFTNTHEFVRESNRHALVLLFLDAHFKGKKHDRRIAYTLDFWKQSQKHMRAAVETIRKAHGTDPANARRAHKQAREEFTHANDAFHRALVQAVRVYNRNVSAYGGQPYFDQATISKMLKFYRTRGLRL